MIAVGSCFCSLRFHSASFSSGPLCGVEYEAEYRDSICHRTSALHKCSAMSLVS